MSRSGTLQTRNRCQYCRLQKCLALGMSRSGTLVTDAQPMSVLSATEVSCTRHVSVRYVGYRRATDVSTVGYRNVSHSACLDQVRWLQTRNRCQYCRLQKCLALDMSRSGTLVTDTQPMSVLSATEVSRTRHVSIRYVGYRCATDVSTVGYRNVSHSACLDQVRWLQTRNRCQYCRLQKCLALGMSRSGTLQTRNRCQYCGLQKCLALGMSRSGTLVTVTQPMSVLSATVNCLALGMSRSGTLVTDAQPMSVLSATEVSRTRHVSVRYVGYRRATDVSTVGYRSVSHSACLDRVRRAPSWRSGIALMLF